MKTIRLKEAAHRAIIDLALLPFEETGRRQPNGDRLVPLPDETFERFERARLPGESDDDLVMRLVRLYRGTPGQ